MKTLEGAIKYYAGLRSAGGDLGKMGATLAATHFGAEDFPLKFKDSLHSGEDQTHHAVAYLSAGINDAGAGASLHMMGDSDNPGDLRLSSVAFGIGKVLREHPERLSQIGSIIYTNICLGKGDPKL